MRFSLSLVAALVGSAAAATNCDGLNQIKKECSSQESFYKRDYFYVGGNYQYNTALSSDIWVNAMYVEKLTGLGGVWRPYPIVLFTAGVPSGAGWLNTPDGRKGWASYFLDNGYQVYIVDQTGMGRGGQNDIASWPLKLATTVKITENAYTAPELINPYPQSQNHTQWPGNGTQGDPAFDALVKSMIPITTNVVLQETTMRAAGCALLNLIGPAFTISHSIGSTYPLLMSDECPTLLKGNINLEPGNIPFQSYVGNSTVPAVGRTTSRPWGLTNTPIGYSPTVTTPSEINTVTVGNDTAALRSCIMQASPIHTLPNVAKVPYVLLTGSASPHITYDHCMVNYLNQAGVSTTWIKLGDVGIKGNAHFMFLEKNNMEIAAVVSKWISSIVGW
ncbi:alpha/beta-hydrolase [Trichodelitschia bisporula]|uniref:Alpha/beta-hydrolase n=1 Tax=Trichodelitschia bisporula TaxID=703511 RepID=A0A6G1I479_9PEZI|nr:alpha/beta-hydrolase [Trichodelitschia bisporula]